MGKTIRFDAKYPNELSKHAKNEIKRAKYQGKQNKKISSFCKKSKKYLKDKFLQRFWPFVDEDNKGHHKI
jgi:hypothetical protein